LDGGQNVSSQTAENVWTSLAGNLERETQEIVSLEKVCCIEDAASQVLEIDTSESVGLASVATKLEQFRISLDRS
jgi:hypothetical protein